MSVLFLVNSQSQLSEGIPWAIRFADALPSTVRILVVGDDPKTLLKHAENQVSDHQSIVSVHSSSQEVDVVVEQVRSSGSRTLLLIEDPSDDTFQRSLFERSPVTCVWLRSRGEPPKTEREIFRLGQLDDAWVDRASLKLLGFRSELELLKASEVAALEGAAGPEQRSSLYELARSAERQRCDQGDLVWVGCQSSLTNDLAGIIGLDLLTSSSHASVALVRRGEQLTKSLATRFERLASRVAEPMGRDQRKDLAESLMSGSVPNLEFLGLISAAAMLAAFGLLQDSAAVIIGAMLIAPLMTPILGAGMALTHGNRPLFQTSLLTILLGFVGAFVSSFLFGCLVRWTQGVSATGEMWARCNPSPLDFCVGFVGGAAASYARTRIHLSAALAGAAIAAALVPPISTAGLQLAFGQFETTQQGTPIVGPLLLVAINVLTIMIGSSIVLRARGMQIDRPENRREKWTLRAAAVLIALILLAFVDVM
ncbi:MAG: DUF389 domain-containing protein [Planctomycetota bacterium]